MTGQPPVIVYVTPMLPWPPMSGGQKRLVMNLEALASVGPVHVIAFPIGHANTDPPPDHLLASLWIHEIGRGALRHRIVDRATSLARLELAYQRSWKRAGGPEILAARVGAVRADIVVLAWPYYAGGIARLRKVAPVIAADIVDDHVASLIGVLRYGPGARARLRALLEWPGIVRSDAAIGGLDQAWFVRSSDAGRFAERHSGLDTRAIHNAVDDVHLGAVAANSGPPQQRSAAFLGSFVHPPNQVAGLRFARGVGPILQRVAPDATLAVIGRHPTSAIRKAAAAAGIELLADVPDAAAAIRRYAVLVVPLSSGEGSNFKILEALALRVPVVTTPVALRGLELVDGIHVLVGRSDDELARAVLRLWQDPALAERLSGAGAALVQRRYGGAGFRTLVVEAIRDLQARRLSGRPSLPSGRRLRGGC